MPFNYESRQFHMFLYSLTIPTGSPESARLQVRAIIRGDEDRPERIKQDAPSRYVMKYSQFLYNFIFDVNVTFRLFNKIPDIKFALSASDDHSFNSLSVRSSYRSH